MDKSKNPKKSKMKIIGISAGIFMLVVVLGSLGVAYYFYGKYKKAVLNSQVPVQNEKSDVIQKAGKLIELPQGEDPELATITDREKLGDQAFFANAQNGDKVLIYKNSRKAFLYRPSTNKIVEMTSLASSSQENQPLDQNSQSQPETQNQNEEQAQAGEQPQPEVKQEPVKVAIYNGANIKGLAAKIAENLAVISGIEISEKINSVGNYKKTLVIDLTGSNADVAGKIAETLGGEIGQFPENEKKPEADILVIGGKE